MLYANNVIIGSVALACPNSIDLVHLPMVNSAQLGPQPMLISQCSTGPASSHCLPVLHSTYQPIHMQSASVWGPHLQPPLADLQIRGLYILNRRYRIALIPALNDVDSEIFSYKLSPPWLSFQALCHVLGHSPRHACLPFLFSTV